MDIKKIAAGAATAGVLGLGGLALGTGLAQAAPHSPVPTPPVPGTSDYFGQHGQQGNPGQWRDGDDWGDRDDVVNQWPGTPPPPGVDGPGVNVGAPDNPIPPGLGYPPPGHGGPMPQDRIGYPTVPSWITTPVIPPVWAPPQPPLPDWATGLPVVWNPELNVWGVWNVQTGTFVRL